MTRLIEVIDDNLKGMQNQKYTFDDLPFAIKLNTEYLSEDIIDDQQSELKQEKKHFIYISKINEEENKKDICAYIAEDEGYLFIQPENETLKIFHNNELIHNSVWMKSGDIVQIENSLIEYRVSGDIISLIINNNIADKSLSSSPLSPPPLQLKKSQIQSEFDKVDNNKQKTISKKTQKNKIVILLMLLMLIISAGFIIFAETISIVISPEADSVELDGFFPVIKLSGRYVLLSGTYQLKIKKNGYRNINENINVDREHHLFSFTLKENPGLIEFNIKPVEAMEESKLYLNDIAMGNSRDQDSQLIAFEIDKGEHEIKIINPWYKTLHETIKVEGKNLQQKFDFELEPNWGILSISSSEDNVNIQIFSDIEKNNDKNKIYELENKNKPMDIKLVTGNYKIKLSKEKFKDKIIEFSIKELQEIKLSSIELEPEDAKLTLISKPEMALILIDGKYIGKTPQTLKVSSFIEHEIEVSLSGYKTQQKRLSLYAEEEKQLNILLEEKMGVVYISTVPKNAKLFIDGKLQKYSSGKFRLSETEHKLTVNATGYRSQTKKINTSSYSKSINFVLDKNVRVKSTRFSEKNKSSTQSIIRKEKSTYINSIKQRMILNLPVTFNMGSSKNNVGRRSNESEHKVNISDAFYLSDKEISNQQFRQYKSTHDSGESLGKTLNSNQQPVVNITWHEAAKFTNWLSQKEGFPLFYKEINGKMLPVDLQKKINGYRLPFESEWSYAARGKKQKKYPWIGQYPPKLISGNFADQSANSQQLMILENYNDNFSVTSTIGSFSKNEKGYYDLGGNVSEWCHDNYEPFSGLSSQSTLQDPKGPERGTHKVVRDASWRDASITELRLSYRNYSKKAANDIGFRIARYAQ